MDREKKKLELEIKKAARDGNKQACVILAKQLVQLRKQETRTLAASSKITGVKTHTSVKINLVWRFYFFTRIFYQGFYFELSKGNGI